MPASASTLYRRMVLDSPPVAANVIVCALLASEGVLAPTLLDHLALDGVRQFARAYHHVMCKFGATLLGFAIAPMQVDFRTNIRGEYRSCRQRHAAARPRYSPR
jgi:cellulose biosynthesis protein BcsQ